MLLLDVVDRWEEDQLTARWVVREHGLFAEPDGSLPGWVGVEIMAQAVAAHVGVRCRLAGLPIPFGMLVGSRRFTTSCGSFAPGESLSVHVQRVMEDGKGLGIWSCRIDGGGAVQEAQLSVYEPPDAAAFLQRSVP